jgi:hypothetical protein
VQENSQSGKTFQLSFIRCLRHNLTTQVCSVAVCRKMVKQLWPHFTDSTSGTTAGARKPTPVRWSTVAADFA